MPALTQRIYIIDWLKALAILMMIIFHLIYDLDVFGMLEIRYKSYFIVWGRVIGALFFICVGANLYHAYHEKIQWEKFFKRLMKISAGAFSISIVTFYMMPNMWIFLGVLHGIVFVSILSLPFVFYPKLAMVFGGIILLANLFFNMADQLFIYLTDYDWLPAKTVDYYPPIPWLGVSLIGIFLAKHQLYPHIIKAPPFLILQLSRHSLFIYLIHQVILYPTVYLISMMLT